MAFTPYDENGIGIECDGVRVWKGEDATYLVLTVAQGRPLPVIAQVIHLLHKEQGREYFVVREVITDMRTNSFTVSCIDQATWFKRMKVRMVRPPRFSTLEEADRWLEEHSSST